MFYFSVVGLFVDVCVCLVCVFCFGLFRCVCCCVMFCFVCGRDVVGVFCVVEFVVFCFVVLLL